MKVNAKGEVFYVVPVPEKELSIFQVIVMMTLTKMMILEVLLELRHTCLIFTFQTSKEEKKEKKTVKKASKLSRLVRKQKWSKD